MRRGTDDLVPVADSRRVRALEAYIASEAEIEVEQVCLPLTGRVLEIRKPTEESR